MVRVMILGRHLFVTAAVCVSMTHAQAAKITAVPLPNPKEAVIIVEGELLLTDIPQFRAKIAPFSSGLVVFKSQGGRVAAGIEIGRIIRLRNFSTWVPSGVMCASSCALAWLGGTPRAMGRMALVGFHAAYRADDTGMSPNAPANAVIGGYLSQLGMSDEAIIYITATHPASMTWLALADAKRVGIDVTLFDPDEMPSPQRAVQEPVPNSGSESTGTSRLAQRSRDFISMLYRSVSRPGYEVLSDLDMIYAPTVRYYGKELWHSQVLVQIERYIDRWPVRQYSPMGAIAVDCKANSSICVVTGQVQFDAKSIERNERSSGVATFEYSIEFHSGENSPRILVENGAVLERNKQALSSEPQEFRWNPFNIR
jgi:hypothetical protein